jgi:hypothetical protein
MRRCDGSAVCPFYFQTAGNQPGETQRKIILMFLMRFLGYLGFLFDKLKPNPYNNTKSKQLLQLLGLQSIFVRTP